MGSVYGVSMGGGTGYITNPTHMVRAAFHPSYWSLKFAQGNNQHYATNDSFWTTLANCGAYVDVNASGSYVTVCNITGGGFFGWALSPAGSGQGQALKITVDGTAYELLVPTTNNARIGVGAMLYNSAGTIADTLYLNAWFRSLGFFFSETPDKGWILDNQTAFISLLHPAEAIMYGQPLCRFNTSLKVEAKGGNASGTNSEYAGACYMLDL